MAGTGHWVYERVASGAEANGETCIFCHQLIRDETQAGYWACHHGEDHPEADVPVEYGYAHWECTQKRLAEQRRDPLSIPEPPDVPVHRRP
jgi:hypothetical protein